MVDNREQLNLLVIENEAGLAQEIAHAIKSVGDTIDTIFVDSWNYPQLNNNGAGRATLISFGALNVLEQLGQFWLDELTKGGPTIILVERRRLSELLDLPVQVQGLLFTDANLSLINEIVFVAQQGHIVFPGRLMPAILTEKFRSQLIERLTAPEQRVLWLLGFGHSNRTIANLLELPESTVKPLVRSTLMKLHFRNRTEAAVFASRLASRWATNPV